MSVKVSTIIPAYNAERTIAQAIDSALAQQFDEHEIIVVNDGSTDSTGAILEKYRHHIRIVTQHNGGLSAARNAAVRRSNGRYLALLDADDIWLPGKLGKMVSMLERNPSASLVFSDYTLMDDNGMIRGCATFEDGSCLERLISQRPLPIYSFPTWISPSTWVTPRETIERIGGFCENFKGPGGYDDGWLLVLLRDAGEFVYVPEQLAIHRTSQSHIRADKYGSGLNIFIRLVSERYGAIGKRLIRSAKVSQCWHLLGKMKHQIKSGDRFGALQTAASIITLSPAFFVSSGFLGCLFRRGTLKRLRKLVISKHDISTASA